MTRYQAVVIGGSAGGLRALSAVLADLPEDLRLTVLAVLHVHPGSSGRLPAMLNETSALPVREAEPGERATPGRVYMAPPNYHLLVEPDRTLSLCIAPRVRYARPSVDVLFESAADVWGPALAAVVLTGANDDGARGARRVRQAGGLVIVQEPRGALASSMPAAAIEHADPQQVLPLRDIAPFLASLPAEEDVP